MALAGRIRGLAAALILAAVPALAFEPAAEDRAAVETRLDLIERSYASSDYGTVALLLPPRALAALAAEAGMAMDEYHHFARHIGRTQIAETLTTEAQDYDLEAAEWGVSASGFPYVLVPAQFEFSIRGAGRYRLTTHMLVLQDKGAWYLLRLSDQNIRAKFMDSYPSFSVLNLPEGEMVLIEAVETEKP